MEDLDIELRRQNATFISRNIFNKNVRKPFDDLILFFEDNYIDTLHKCIEILRSKQFAKKRLKFSLLDISASAFWNDLYYLNYYDTTIAELESKLDTVKNSYECEDDYDDKYQYKKQLDRIQSDIEALSTIIELTKQVRQLILIAIPDIETLWEQKLIEHNALQEKSEAEKLEREVMRAEIRKNKLNAIQKPDTEIQTSNDLICDKKLLQKLHAEFDDEIWENMDFDDFLNCMRVEPIGGIKLKCKKQDFAKWVHDNIEDKRNETLIPDIGIWFKKIRGKNVNYSSQKKIAEQNTAKIQR
ncbi:MAG: hypothetical protein Q7J14_01520 [Candidatus Magasanikbacteria bacterium]|nr:hypothetical protein [Candidatus Magasanikbacteria bacterium]